MNITIWKTDILQFNLRHHMLGKLSFRILWCFVRFCVHTCTFHTSHHLDSMVAFLMVYIWFWDFHRLALYNCRPHIQMVAMFLQAKQNVQKTSNTAHTEIWWFSCFVLLYTKQYFRSDYHNCRIDINVLPSECNAEKNRTLKIRKLNL